MPAALALPNFKPLTTSEVANRLKFRPDYSRCPR